MAKVKKPCDDMVICSNEIFNFFYGNIFFLLPLCICHYGKFIFNDISTMKQGGNLKNGQLQDVFKIHPVYFSFFFLIWKVKLFFFKFLSIIYIKVFHISKHLIFLTLDRFEKSRQKKCPYNFYSLMNIKIKVVMQMKHYSYDFHSSKISHFVPNS